MTTADTALDKIKPLIKDKNLEPGVAYIIFSCGCIVLQKNFKKKEKIFRTRNNQRKNVCPNHPEFENEYVGKYRICARCKKEEAIKKGRGFETNVCKECNSSEWDLFRIETRKDETIDKAKLRAAIKNDIPIKRKKRTKYYQNGKRIKEPGHPETDPLCGNRDKCLDAAGYESDTFIHCTGCPNRKSWIDI